VAEPRAMRTVARGVPDGGLVTTVKDENEEKVTKSQTELEDDQSLLTGAGTHAPPHLVMGCVIGGPFYIPDTRKSIDQCQRRTVF
jgi:hypothetical protein